MEKFNSRKVAEIIIRMHIDKVQEGDREYLLRWMDESEYNRQAYRNIISGESLKDRVSIEQRIADSDQLEEIVSRIARTIGYRQRVKRYSIVASVVAVSLLLMLVVTPFIKPTPKTVVITEQVAVTEVAPTLPNSKVRLITDRGQVIALENNEKRAVEYSQLVQQSMGEEEKKLSSRLAATLGIETIEEEINITNTIITEAGGEILFTLPDGTKVWLNALSRLEFPTLFGSKQREVWLTGEAYFDVESSKTRPFIVHCGDHSVKVLGTQFNIMAYSNEEEICTTLFKGVVEVATKGEDAIKLASGMEARYNNREHSFTLGAADLDEVAAWRLGHFIFTGNDIESILRVLSRWYGVEFYNKSKGTHTFTGRVSKYSTLEGTLNALKRAGGPSYQISEDGETVILRN